MNDLAKFVLWIVAILAAVSTILYFAFFDVWRVPSDYPQFSASIAPTLAPGDLVLISRHGTPSFANVVRCADPDAAGRFVVGRFVGIGGDKIDLGGESLTVNGQHIPSPRACLTSKVTMQNPASGIDEELSCSQQEIAGMTYEVLVYPEHPEPSKSTVVESGKAFLLSDNRHMHLDSRDFGVIDPSSCKHVVFRLVSAAGYGDSKRRFTLIW